MIVKTSNYKVHMAIQYNSGQDASRSRLATLSLSSLFLALLLFAGFGSKAQTVVGFGSSELNGASSFLATSLDFGPDGRLYVAQQDGLIKAYTIVRLGPNNYIVTDTEDIDIVQQIPNHDDDGTFNATVTTRQVLGVHLSGDSLNPIMWVSSSDPRIGAGVLGVDLNLDTNSGVISKVYKDSTGAWVREDWVRGLPRSEENHASNGIELDEVNNILYLAQGGNTNAGTRSNNFAGAPEYAYSAAILAIYLDSISSFPYDLPTLDDEDRFGVNDFNDPFGGNNGKNQAILEVDGPVQVYAGGFRNPYDVIITENGRMYTWDNGANAGWGDFPLSCADTTREGGLTYQDGLHFVSGEGYYGGHPNVIRGDRNNTFNPTNPQSPVPAALENPEECLWLEPGVDDSTIVLHPASSNGLAEYTATNFDSAITGYLLCATFDGKIVQVELNEEGNALGGSGKQTFAGGFGAIPLDVIAVGDDGPFPGTVWTANIFATFPINVFEPNDYGGGSGAPCDFSVGTEDADMDGYTNQDEIDNATNPCSAADRPSDADGDFISDLNDTDDDNDGIDDIHDVFAIDSLNGSETFMPLDYDWEPGDDPLGGFFQLGFTGLMNNGETDYLDQFDPVNITAGGTAGLFTIDNVSNGGSKGEAKNQENAFQFGVNVDTVTRPFVISTRIEAPFAGFTPADFQSMGIFFGTGDMDNYAKLVVEGNAGAGGIEFLLEEDTVSAPAPITLSYPAPVLGTAFTDLFLTIDPVAGTVQPAYSVNGGLQTDLGGPRNYPLEWTDSILAVGIISTSFGATPFPATWNFVRVEPLGPKPSAEVTVNGGNFLSGDIIFPNSWSVTNTTANNGDITKMTIDLTTALLPDLIFDPTGAGGDSGFKDFTIDSGSVSAGYLSHSFAGFRDGGYDSLIIEFSDFNPGETFEFSLDVDPLSIQGLSSPGPSASGKVAGSEVSGAKIELDFSTGTTIGGNIFHDFSTTAIATNRIDLDTIVAPSIEMVGVSLPDTVNDASQVIRVTGIAGATVKLLQAESGLFLGSNPGFDIDDYESNLALSLTEYTATIEEGGTVDIPVTLLESDADGGRNIFTAVLDGGTRVGLLSNELTVRYINDTLFTNININCGSTAYTAFDGTQYVDDAYFTISNSFINNSIPDIAGTVDDDLYTSERTTFNLTYDIPVENGDYDVTLHFAEIFYGATGGTIGGSGLRVQDVTIEGMLMIDDLDIFDSVGAETALVFTFPVTVTDETMTILLNSVVNKVKISAIQIAPATPSGPVCEIPSNIIETPSTTGINLSWDPVPGAFGYQLRGRRAGMGSFRSITSGSNSRTVTGLTPSTSYEYQVRAGCPGDTSDFSPLDTFTTLSLKAIADGIEDENEGRLKVFPNPVEGPLCLEFQAPETEEGWLRIISVTGAVILEKSFGFTQGINTLCLEGKQLRQGSYLLEIKSGRHIEVQRFTVIR